MIDVDLEGYTCSLTDRRTSRMNGVGLLLSRFSWTPGFMTPSITGSLFEVLPQKSLSHETKRDGVHHLLYPASV